MQDFRRDFTKEHLKELTPKERLEGLSPERIEKYLKRRKQNPRSETQEGRMMPR
jgi:hypothetical protein